MQDSFGRKIDYMRISVTDRCNFRCRYCMPRGIQTSPMSDILTYEEIIEIVKIAAQCGISKLKITGGDPLVRQGITWLVQELRKIPGIRHITMTTNGALLTLYAKNLKDAGLEAINISLDSLDRKVFSEITGFDKLDNVLAGIDAALSAGLQVKINSVLQENCNVDEWQALLNIAKDRPIDVRFIEMMPIGEAKNFRSVNNEELLAKIRGKYPAITPDTSIHGNGPAVYFKIPGFLGCLGFISAMNKKFCGSCNRIRLTANGMLKPCLCFAKNFDLRKILRETNKIDRPEKLALTIRTAIEAKPQAHSFENEELVSEYRKMFEIGG